MTSLRQKKKKMIRWARRHPDRFAEMFMRGTRRRRRMNWSSEFFEVNPFYPYSFLKPAFIGEVISIPLRNREND